MLLVAQIVCEVPEVQKSLNPGKPSLSSFHHSDAGTASHSPHESVLDSVSPIVEELEDDKQFFCPILL